MKRSYIYPWGALLYLLTVLAACAQFGLAPAKTFQDDVQYAKATLTGVYKGITAGVTSGTITESQKAGYLQRADLARDNIKAAESLAGTAATQAQGAALITTTITVLTILQTELQKQMGSK